MSKINERVANLLEENRELFEGKYIAFDGVVDEERFMKSDIKTLFLLKEVNYPDMEKDWTDFMENTRQQAYADTMYKTWPNICLWLEALHKTDVDFVDCTDEYGNFDTKKLQKNLLETAVVNIKKTAGGGSSKYEEILYAANKYGHIIVEEIEKCICPELVICGGTFDFAKIMFKVENEEIKTLPSGAKYFEKDNIFYLEFVHPMWFMVDRNILFAYAKTVFSDVCKLLKGNEDDCKWKLKTK